MISPLVLTSLLVSPLHVTSETAPPFYWGTATAAYQIEGGYQDDGKGPSVWDDWSHKEGTIANGDTGDVADDSYHKWTTDIALMKELGVNSYRFSLSWPRIQPTGSGDVNPAGLAYYDKLIDDLLEANIEPFVTLFHWDTPMALEESIGGWLNPDMETYFAAYADICFEHFGDRVTHWVTLNEPFSVATNGYLWGVKPPGRCSDRTKCAQGDSVKEPYLVAHNFLNGHAAAVQVYREKYQPIQKGEISIVINSNMAYPLNTSAPVDQAAAQRHLEFEAGWFADPVHFGDYPQSMRDYAGDHLPVFTPEQKIRIQNSTDFFGLNHYSSKYFADAPCVDNNMGWIDDQCVEDTHENMDGELIGLPAESPWLYVVPSGMHDVITWVANRYGNPKLFVTENGVDVPGEKDMTVDEILNDSFRVDYMEGYLKNMLKAKDEGANVQGYFTWSLMDNFEWSNGYDWRFGLHYVDRADEKLPRYQKNSAKWFRDFIQDYQGGKTTNKDE